MGDNSNSSVRVRFASFELDIESGELRKHGRPIRLQPQPSRVLAALVSRPGELVTRQELRQKIWDGTTFVDFEQGLNFCIRQIRLVLWGEIGASGRMVGQPETELLPSPLLSGSPADAVG